MVDVAEVTGLISGIYEAAVDGQGWPEVLQRALVLIGGSSALLYSKPRADAARVLCSVGVEPYFCSLYLADYPDLKPVVAFEEALPPGAVFAASDALPDAQLRACSFFHEWLQPQGCVDFLSTVLERCSDGLTRLIVNRHEQRGLMDDRARDTLSLLVPHLQRALRIGRLVEQSESRAIALSEALERVTTAAIDLDQRVQWAARHYAFTPAEARVVQALMRGGTIAGIARRLGITEATVKTHLQHVFDKTDTRRQVDLVKRIAVHAPPPPRAAHGPLTSLTPRALA